MIVNYYLCENKRVQTFETVYFVIVNVCDCKLLFMSKNKLFKFLPPQMSWSMGRGGAGGRPFRQLFGGHWGRPESVTTLPAPSEGIDANDTFR